MLTVADTVGVQSFCFSICRRRQDYEPNETRGMELSVNHPGGDGAVGTGSQQGQKGGDANQRPVKPEDAGTRGRELP